MLISTLPEGLVYSLAGLLGRFAYRCLRIRRRVTMTNLKQALGGEFSEKSLNNIACKSYENISMTFIECLLFPKLKNRLPQRVSLPDIAVIKQYTDKNQGAVIVSCHLGNWELTAASVATAGIPLTVVAARLSNPYVDDYINRFRTGFGMKVLTSTASAKKLVRSLKSHETLGLLSDQDAGRKGIFVDFFGRPTSTPRGAALLTLKYKVPIIVAVTIRTRPGHYKNIFREVEVREDDTTITLTQRYTTILEEIIRQYPEQYFWMHRRWKTRPPQQNI